MSVQVSIEVLRKLMSGEGVKNEDLNISGLQRNDTTTVGHKRLRDDEADTSPHRDDDEEEFDDNSSVFDSLSQDDAVEELNNMSKDELNHEVSQAKSEFMKIRPRDGQRVLSNEEVKDRYRDDPEKLREYNEKRRRLAVTMKAQSRAGIGTAFKKGGEQSEQGEDVEAEKASDRGQDGRNQNQTRDRRGHDAGAASSKQHTSGTATPPRRSTSASSSSTTTTTATQPQQERQPQTVCGWMHGKTDGQVYYFCICNDLRLRWLPSSEVPRQMSASFHEVVKRDYHTTAPPERPFYPDFYGMLAPFVDKTTVPPPLKRNAPSA